MKKIKWVLLLLVAQSTLYAEFRACNNTRAELAVAAGKAYWLVLGEQPETEHFESSGWWRLQPGECVTLDTSGRRRIALYANAADGRIWSGVPEASQDRLFCLSRKAFVFDGGRIAHIHENPEVCAQYGGQLQRFASKLSYTEQHIVRFIDGKDPIIPPMNPVPGPKTPEFIRPTFDPNKEG